MSGIDSDMKALLLAPEEVELLYVYVDGAEAALYTDYVAKLNELENLDAWAISDAMTLQKVIEEMRHYHNMMKTIKSRLFDIYKIEIEGE